MGSSVLKELGSFHLEVSTCDGEGRKCLCKPNRNSVTVEGGAKYFNLQGQAIQELFLYCVSLKPALSDFASVDTITIVVLLDRHLFTLQELHVLTKCTTSGQRNK
jgi:hypothetical protein